MSNSISVVMCNHNKGLFVEDAIRSVLAQTFADWELVIVDDGSGDDSLGRIRKYLHDERVALACNDKNIGYVPSLKRGIEESAGSIICILDSDDALAPEALARVASAYQENPDAGLVYTQCYYCNELLNPMHTGFSSHIPEGRTNLHYNAINAMRTFKKSVYDKTEGYNSQMLYAEDIDLNLKLEEAAPVYFIDEPLYYYRVLPRSQTHGFRRTRVNRANTAKAKLSAYERRLESGYLNLDTHEISEVLFWGLLNAFLAADPKTSGLLAAKLLRYNPNFIVDFKFYDLLMRKMNKIKRLKQEKPLLSV